MHTTNFDLSLEEITKIEGAASLDLSVRDGKVTDLKFKISEFKRFYTQGVRGKSIVAVPQLVARVCGTCSNAHLLCSVKAIETALGVIPSAQTTLMRRLAMNGLMIRDHALHIYVFSLPDMLGRDSILTFNENDPREHQLLHDTFTVKAAGNQLSIAFGGRSVHAPFAALGGFLQTPDANTLEKTKKLLIEARPAVLRLIHECQICPFIFEDQSQSVALTSDTDYQFLKGTIKKSDGTVILEPEFRTHLEKVIIPYSHATGYKFDGETFIVGAVARMNLNRDKLHQKTKNDAADAIARFPSKNVYLNNLAQAIEILNCIDESLEILESHTIFEKEPLSQISTANGVGVGVIEAPRGTLYHRYTIENKTVTDAEIIVPTGQNQIAIEKNLVRVVEEALEKNLDRDAISHEIEQFIRVYDPCMSCASHFLKIKWM